MKLIFIRHAEAEDAGHGAAGADERRRLTKKGERQSRRMGDTLESLGVRPSLILASPLTRAVETANIIASRIKKSPAPVKTDTLQPSATWDHLKRSILTRARPPVADAKKKPPAGQDRGEAVIFAVGHQPNLGEMAAAALAADSARGIEMQKGACIGLAWKGDKMEGAPEICLALTPEAAKRIRKLGR
ncbi:MAG: phosphoglycerate mutase family protein [bacterium]